MIGVEGGVFRIRLERCLAHTKKPDRSSLAMTILSEMATILQKDGLKITKPKRAKHEDAKGQCLLGADLGIDIYVSPQEIEQDCSVFLLCGFGFAGKNCGSDDAELSVMNAWKRIQNVAEQVVWRLHSTRITWMTIEELDARKHSR
jgi:hypothetical protein